MADEDRNVIESYVLDGNLRDASKALVVDPGRQAELRARMANLREGGQVAALPAPEADSNPGDFRAAIEERERAAELIQTRGKDTPRVNADKQPMKAIYLVNDSVAALPAPGGLGALLLVILLFFFILIPATSAGETRALLLWEVLLGRKQILDPASIPTVDAGSGNIGSAIGGAIAGAGAGIKAGIGIATGAVFSTGATQPVTSGGSSGGMLPGGITLNAAHTVGYINDNVGGGL